MIFSSEYIKHYKQNFILAYPVMISQLGHIMVSLADSIMVGQTGTIPLAACSLGNAIFTVFLVTGLGYSYGLTPLIAQENGKKNFKQCGVLLEHGMFANLFLGALLFILAYFSAEIVPYLNQPKDVAAQAKPFIKIVGASVLPLMIFLTFKQFAEGLAFTKQAMVISIAANILNIGLNYVLIYGKLGVPALGLNGAGYANLIARIFMAIAMAWYVLRSVHFKKHLKNFHIRNLETPILKQLNRIGVPISLQFIFEVGAFTGAAIVIGWIGTNELAAHQIALSLAAVTYMAASGISAAATVRVGSAFGQKDFHSMHVAGMSSFIMSALFMATCACVFIVLNHVLPTFYVDDQAVITIAASLLIIAALFQLSDGIQVVGLGTLRGMSDVKIPTFITLIAYWVIGLPIGYWLGVKLQFGVQGVWIGLLIGLTTAAILLFSRFNYASKKLYTDHATE